jgi:serine/threonine protein kinase
LYLLFEGSRCPAAEQAPMQPHRWDILGAVPREGQLLAQKYKLERFLGSGGFASVWAARNVKIDRPVALKIMADIHARDAAFLERFNREATLAARSIHPSIVRVEDIDSTEDGVPFLVMELLEGRTLKSELKARGRLPMAEGLLICREVLRGLSAAHALGVVHRDIKPANVFIVANAAAGARVRILDLGLAKSLADERDITRSGQVVGTPDYIAPEQLVGRGSVRSSPSADVFSCGVMLFEVLAGKRPLDAGAQSNAHEERLISLITFYATGQPLPSLADVLEDPPADVDALLARSLALVPEKRFLDAGEMLAALERATIPGEAPAAAQRLTAPDPGGGEAPGEPTLLNDVEPTPPFGALAQPDAEASEPSESAPTQALVSADLATACSSTTGALRIAGGFSRKHWYAALVALALLSALVGAAYLRLSASEGRGASGRSATSTAPTALPTRAAPTSSPAPPSQPAGADGGLGDGGDEARAPAEPESNPGDSTAVGAPAASDLAARRPREKARARGRAGTPGAPQGLSRESVPGSYPIPFDSVAVERRPEH